MKSTQLLKRHGAFTFRKCCVTFTMAILCTMFGTVYSECPDGHFETVAGSGSDGTVPGTYSCTTCSGADPCPTNYLVSITGICSIHYTYSGFGLTAASFDDGGTTTTINPLLQADCSTAMPTNCSKPNPCVTIVTNAGTASYTYTCPDDDPWVYSWTKNTATGDWDEDDEFGDGTFAYTQQAPYLPAQDAPDNTYSDVTSGACPNQTETMSCSGDWESEDCDAFYTGTEVIATLSQCWDQKTTTTWGGSSSDMCDGSDVVSWSGTYITESKFQTPYSPADMEGRADSAAQGSVPSGTGIPPWATGQPASVRGLSSSCASETKAKYRISISGTDPKKKYTISWQMNTHYADGTTVADTTAVYGPFHIQGQAGLWYYPSASGADVPMPTWPVSACVGGTHTISFIGPIIIAPE